MSKWVKDEMFEELRENKIQENEKKPAGPRRSEIVWPNPQKGTPERPRSYQGRFIPDPNGELYRKFFYHMFQQEDRNWRFVLCEKTFDFEKFCPFCTANQKLYMGNDDDKDLAKRYKRKVKFLANWYVIKDPRDSERDNPLSYKVWIYEFPSKVEQIVRQEIIDREEGLGKAIFDPGSSGHDFILKVGATNPDHKGQTWPDYAMSTFSRTPRPIADTDEEIEAILNQTHSLEEYIQSMKRPKENIKEIVDSELLWDLLENEWNSSWGSVSTSEGSQPQQESSNQTRQSKSQYIKEEDAKIEENETSKDEEVKDEEVKDEEVKDEPKQESSSGTEDEDEELLKQLKDL